MDIGLTSSVAGNTLAVGSLEATASRATKQEAVAQTSTDSPLQSSGTPPEIASAQESSPLGEAPGQSPGQANAVSIQEVTTNTSLLSTQDATAAYAAGSEDTVSANLVDSGNLVEQSNQESVDLSL